MLFFAVYISGKLGTFESNIFCIVFNLGVLCCAFTTTVFFFYPELCTFVAPKLMDSFYRWLRNLVTLIWWPRPWNAAGYYDCGMQIDDVEIRQMIICFVIWLVQKYKRQNLSESDHLPGITSECITIDQSLL